MTNKNLRLLILFAGIFLLIIWLIKGNVFQSVMKSFSNVEYIKNEQPSFENNDRATDYSSRDYSSDNQVFDFAEVAPEYPGGINALRAEVQKAYEIPREYKTSGEKGGSIITRFTVQPDGDVGNIKVIRDIPDCASCNAEAIKAIESLQYRFRPGMQDGEAVAVRFTLPIVIEIR